MREKWAILSFYSSQDRLPSPAGQKQTRGMRLGLYGPAKIVLSNNQNSTQLIKDDKIDDVL